MNIKFVLFTLALIVSISASKAETTANTETIFYDPFQKPELIKPSLKAETDKNQTNASLWKPELIMTLRAGKKSMANIDGQIINIGEKMAGHKLIEVNERSVVFVNKGKITRLTLDEQ